MRRLCGRVRQREYQLYVRGQRGPPSVTGRRVGLLGLVAMAMCCWMVPSTAAAAPPTVAGQWASEVTAASVTLHAEINPENEATTYRFEFAESEAALLDGHGEAVPAPPTEGDLDAGEAVVAVQVHVQGLTPHTGYWYRVVARNETGETPGCPAAASCGSFTTRPTSPEAALPDGRRWELVSPAVKDGALIAPIGGSGIVQAAEGGGAVTYLSDGAATSGPDEQPSGNPVDSQLLSVRSRGGGGWSTRDIATPHEVSTGAPVGEGQEYRWFSPDLSLSLVQPLGSGPTGSKPEGAALLSPGTSEKTIYLRDDTPLSPTPAGETAYGDAEREAAEPESEAGYLPLATGCASAQECRTPRVKELADVPPGTRFGEKLFFLDATDDASHAVVASRSPLEAGANENELYEWTAGESATQPGRLRLVSRITEGEQASRPILGDGESGATPEAPVNARGAISDDGASIFFTASHNLFVRDTSSEPEQTVQLDVVQPGVVSPGSPSPAFQFASGDGSKVFFTDGQLLTAESGSGDLYECELEKVAGKLQCKLTDLTPLASGAGVKNLALVGSESSSYLYFAASGELTKEENARGEKAEAGADNLYLLHYNDSAGEWEAPVFIAVLSSLDANDWAGRHRLVGLGDMTARVSPDGRYLVFMSERGLTGYDNEDVASGVPDEEVFLYQAPTASKPGGRLVCVSCNPTGERPAGVMDAQSAREGEGLLVDQQRIWAEGRWLAGSVPGWIAMSLDVGEYQSRYLENDGRVFFDSPDDLVAQATNGLENVYEYEPEGEGGCERSSGSFDARAEGCLALISSGDASEESAFLDAGGAGPAGEDGEDVFFLTSQSLVSADRDTAFDVYDAHECSAAAPCESEAAAASPCDNEEACRVAPTPQPTIYGAPSSATFAGAGNPMPSAVTAPPLPSPQRCAKGQRPSHGRCVKRKTRKVGRKKKGGKPSSLMRRATQSRGEGR